MKYVTKRKSPRTLFPTPSPNDHFYHPPTYMTANVTSTPHNFLTDLEQAAIAFRDGSKIRPNASVVVEALLLAEKTAKQQRTAYPYESLLGNWRLCFATGTRKVRERGGIVLGKGFYIPKLFPAYIMFSIPDINNLAANQGEIGNQIQLGTLKLKLTGPAQYLGKKNLLAFDFTQMQISLFGRTIYNGKIRSGKDRDNNFYEQSITKLPFFAFFLITENFIAARGRGGGLALWVREN
jgi:hypothetical protein